MPIFEYTCLRCLHRFEKVQKSQEEQEILCPECASSEVRKELSSFSTASGGTSSSPSCSTGGG